MARDDPRGYLPTLQDLARKHDVTPPALDMDPGIYLHTCVALMALELGIWKPTEGEKDG